MAKKITSQDLIQDGVFEPTIQDALKLEGALKNVMAVMKEMAATSKAAFSGNNTSYEAIEKTNKAYSDVVPMSKEYAKMQSQIVSLQERLNLLTQGHTDELVRLQQQYNSLLQAKKNEIGASNELLGAYANLDRQNKANIKTLKDLIVAGKDGTTEFRNLKNAVQEATNTLSKADQAAGQFGRNVGNYEMATHKYRYSLFQVQQVLRELPNFAMSARVGFMALSNNLPILASELTKVANSVDEVTGKKNGWLRTMKMVGAEILGWQTLLLVGITLVVQYANEIGKWASALFKGNEALQALKNNAETNAYAMEKASKAYQDATSNVMELMNQIKLAKDGFMDKNTVLDIYNETLGKTLGVVGSLEEAEKRLIAQAPDYVSMLMYKAAAEEASKEGAKRTYETQKDIMDLENSSAYKEYKSMSKEDLSKLMNSQQEGAKQRAMRLYRAGAERKTLEEQLQSDQSSYTELNLRLQRMAAEMASKYGWNIKPWTDKDVSNLFGSSGGSSDGKKGSSGGSSKSSGGKIPEIENLDNVYKQWRDEMELLANDAYLKQQMTKRAHSQALLEIEAQYIQKTIDLYVEAGKNTVGLETRMTEIKMRMLGTDETDQKDIKDQKGGVISNSGKVSTVNTKVQNQKQAIQELMNLYKAWDQYLSNREKNEQAKLSREINMAQTRTKELQLLSAQGVKTASDSIAYEERKEKELERKQDQIAKRQQRRQLASSAISAFNSQIQSGKSPQQALLMTGAEMTALIAMISAFPTFYEGIENVDESHAMANLKTSKDPFIARIHPGERIMTAEQNAMVGNMSNDDLAQLAYLYQSGYAPVNVDAKGEAGNPVVRKLESIETAIREQKPPETFFSDTEKAMVRVIHTQNKVTKEIHKVGGIFGGR